MKTVNEEEGCYRLAVMGLLPFEGINHPFFFPNCEDGPWLFGWFEMILSRNVHVQARKSIRDGIKTFRRKLFYIW